ILSKVDRVVDISRVKAEVQSINPQATLIPAQFGDVDPALLQKSGTDPVFSSAASHDGAIRTFVLKFQKPVPQALLERFLTLLIAQAFGQADYPNKPVRMVVGFAAGGISDVLGRAITIPLSKQLGQQVIVENKPGAGTTIAGDFTVKSAPDGYNIWLQDITTHAINNTLYPKLPYDSMKDFSFIAMVASTPLMLVVHPSTPANNVRELIELLKSSPG